MSGRVATALRISRECLLPIRLIPNRPSIELQEIIVLQVVGGIYSAVLLDREGTKVREGYAEEDECEWGLIQPIRKG
jgi:hypothetical protein